MFVDSSKEHRSTRNLRILLNDKRVKADARDNYAIRHAADKGLYRSVELLLKDPSVDPTSCDSFAWRMAATHGHYQTMKALLLDGRCDVNYKGNFALIQAIEKKWYAIIYHLLMVNEKMDLSIGTNEIISSVITSLNGRALVELEKKGIKIPEDKREACETLKKNMECDPDILLEKMRIHM